MGLFGKKTQGRATPRVRAGNCIYVGEPFPTTGERIAIAGIEVDVIFDQDAIPGTWTGMVRLIQQSSGEPDEKRVFTNILGLLLATADNTFATKLGPGLGLEDAAAVASAQLRRGEDDLASYRKLFASHSDGVNAFDFEVVKLASLAASPWSAGPRREAGWPPFELWKGDLTLFHM